jgi:hypothetical protein
VAAPARAEVLACARCNRQITVGEYQRVVSSEHHEPSAGEKDERGTEKRSSVLEEELAGRAAELHRAVEGDDLAAVAAALRFGGGAAQLDRVAYEGATALGLAAEGGRLAAGGLLLEWGFEADQVAEAPGLPGGRGPTPLYIAAREGHVEFVRLLLSHQVRRQPLAHSYCCSQGRLHNAPRWANLRCQATADIQMASTGYAALHIAAERGHADICWLLLAGGAHPDLPLPRRPAGAHPRQCSAAARPQRGLAVLPVRACGLIVVRALCHRPSRRRSRPHRATRRWSPSSPPSSRRALRPGQPEPGRS